VWSRRPQITWLMVSFPASGMEAGLTVIDDLAAKFFEAFDNRVGGSRVDEARSLFAEGSVVVRTTAGDDPAVLTVDDFIAPRLHRPAPGPARERHVDRLS
jgi:hypothetical protein